MLLRYFIRENDPDLSIFEVDFHRSTWRVLPTDPDEAPVYKKLKNNGIKFLTPAYAEWEVRSVSRSGNPRITE